MVKKYLSLMVLLAAIGMGRNSLSAGEPALADLIEPNKIHRIPFYSTGIKCTSTLKIDKKGNVYTVGKSGARSVEGAGIELDIVTQEEDEEKNIGRLLVQFYPNSTPYAEGYSPTGHIIRLKKIWVGAEFGETDLQKHGHGTMAMEALLTLLRKVPVFKESKPAWELWLEYDSSAHLTKWYESFGLQKKATPVSLKIQGGQYMAALLDKTRFPLFKKKKAAEKALAEKAEAK